MAPRTILLAAALFALGSPAAIVHAAPLDQPAQPLAQALDRFSRQAGLQVLAAPELLRGRQAQAVSGARDAGDALAQMLRGTGLRGRIEGRTLVIESAATDAPVTLSAVTVTAQDGSGGVTEGTGSYSTAGSSTATRLALSLRETPQSVTVITRQQMDDQGLADIADVLRQAPGITVNRDNTEGYSFYSRGFLVENYQFDGVPSLSSAGGNVRDNYSITDSTIYDRVEILKGATGLVNGAGNPSGVINLIRKRPTADFRGHASIGAGSWDDYRGEVDVSGPLTEDGRLRGRLVAAVQDSRSFIDHLKTRKEVLYGIVEADLTDSTTLSLGVNVQKNKNDATTNAHLPAFYSDGRVARFPRSTNAADIWSYRNQDTQHLFATLEHDFGGDWNLKAHLGQRRYESREVIAGMRNVLIDANTHSHEHANPVNRFNTNTTEENLDLQVSGGYTLFDRKHQLVLGYSVAHTDAGSNSWIGASDSLISDVFNWDNNAAQPTDYAWVLSFNAKVRQKIGYAATVLKPTDRLSLILGARVTDYSWNLDGVFASNFRSNFSTKVSGKLIPYAGVTFDIDGHHTIYASYTDVFKPQAYEYDVNDRQLDPLTGKSHEFGVKGSYLGGKLNASAALFQLKQDNYAINDPSGATRPGGGVARVAIQGVTTRGAELELFGELLPGWQLGAGLTYIQPRDADDRRVSTTQPEKTFKLSTMYRLPGEWRHLSIGGSVQWQSETYFMQTVAGAPRRFEQDGHAIVGLVAGMELSRQLKATLNIDNLSDKRYYAGIGNYNTVYWGTPRSLKLNLRYDF
ncbi:TonB-dependent siderophore receptor [Thauera sp. Sel9]|uniref:TonB-dependent siderophore receptor n=1 Tax=Thauera sp. Sel9 TaxID=2974299 RepID=UPI0021E181ED|nr:TonB-dependent receptor [Thauera sp. Sel9]MCV2218854.1 TonB-dependent receptor [Thauera sp. Sel9]